MTAELATIHLTWDGRLLRLRLVWGQEMTWMTTMPQRKPQNWSKHCAGVEEVTDFELSAFLHQPVAEIEREWKLGRQKVSDTWTTDLQTDPLF